MAKYLFFSNLYSKSRQMATLRSTKVEYFFQIQTHLSIICASLNTMSGLYPFGQI